MSEEAYRETAQRIVNGFESLVDPDIAKQCLLESIVDAIRDAVRDERFKMRSGMEPESFFALLDRARKDFPHAFPCRGKPAAPLAIGVYHELREAWPDIDARTAHNFLNSHTKSHAYLLGHIEGRPRRHLDGRLEGSVSAENQEMAKKRLEGLKSRKEKKILKKQALSHSVSTV